MTSWLPSIPYPPPKPAGFGYWEPITSTLDWCEENYYATKYSAEIVNTLTNLTFVALAFRGIYNCSRNGHDPIFFVTFVGYFMVACGSMAFHSTLQYPWQLVDELSMIYTTCLLTYASFEHNRSLLFQIMLGLSVTSLAVFITVYYHYSQDPVFHQTAYGILTAVVLSHSMYVMEVALRPSWRKKDKKQTKVAHMNGNGAASTHMNGNGAAAPYMNGNGAISIHGFEQEQRRKDDRDRWILGKMWALIGFGLLTFVGGFGIWNLDNVFCSTARGWRHEVGLPWGIVLEGHGWWHVGTGLGAYYFIVWGIWLRHCLNGRQDEFELRWSGGLTSVPDIVRKPALMNGHAKKSR